MRKPNFHKIYTDKGYHLKEILKGFFKENGEEIISPVYHYIRDFKNRETHKFISRFGIYTTNY